MTLDQYATFSNYAVASATIVLALAWGGHMAEWAFARQVGARAKQRRTREAAVADGAQSLPVASGARVIVAVEEQTDEAGPTYRSELAGRIGLALTVLAWLILLSGVITRTLATGDERVPWANMYEFSMTGSVLALGVYLVLVKLQHIQWLGGIVTGFIVVVLGLSMTVYVPAGPVVPALHSYWLVIHVISVMIAGGAFLVGAALSILYLVKSRAEERTPEAERTGYLWQLPTSAVIDRLSYRVNALGFPLWTFGALIAGPIWAQYAWGRYWGWDPKEVWAFITWVGYAGYLHARATAGWKGKGAAVLALIAFGSFLFNYVGVNLFMDGLHSYAK